MSQENWTLLDEEIINCQRCERLLAYCRAVAQIKRRAYQNQIYWGKPLPGFGDRNAQLLIVGLAPGAHGANRTGRMFTGDSSGDFLYRALYKAGFANQPYSIHREDGLELQNVYITAVCRCAPPQNKPLPTEIRNCLPYLYQEMNMLSRLRVVVALGRIAFDQMVNYFNFSPKPFFQHGACYTIANSQKVLIASYHPSRQNTQTGRLTEPMFDHIWKMAKSFLEGD
ncbi:MAG: uracil-DNA glycosylase [Anaerolineales bacterium]|nr:uracil-DNA glycosylase [Anaerolineales bacterium]